MTRRVIALLLIKSLGDAGYVPPICDVAPFDDVLPGDAFCPWIQQALARGVSFGCETQKYCPIDPVTRGQLAKLMVETYDLTLP